MVTVENCDLHAGLIERVTGHPETEPRRAGRDISRHLGSSQNLVVAADRQLVRLRSRFLLNIVGVNYLPKTKPARSTLESLAKSRIRRGLRSTGGKVKDTFVAQSVGVFWMVNPQAETVLNDTRVQ